MHVSVSAAKRRAVNLGVWINQRKEQSIIGEINTLID